MNIWSNTARRSKAPSFYRPPKGLEPGNMETLQDLEKWRTEIRGKLAFKRKETKNLPPRVTDLCDF